MDRYEKPEAKPSQKIYISNLSMDTTQNDLRKSFESYGTIVDINLKSKNTGIVFAFIEFDSVDSARSAVEAMNKKTLMDKQLKVQFAHGPKDKGGFRGGDRDRDRDRGFRGRGDSDRRPRDGGDRPRGCFNCGQEGHYAKQCSKPRQPRDFNRDRNDRNDRDGRGRSDYRGGDRRGDRDRDRDRDYRHKKRQQSKSSSSNSRSRSEGKKKRQRRNKSSSSSRS